MAANVPPGPALSRRVALSSMACAGGVALLPAAVRAAPPLPPPKDTTEIRFGFRLTDDNAALTEGGFLDRYGVRVKSRLFSTGIDSREGLISGQADLVQLGVTPLVVLLGRFKDLRIVAPSVPGGGKYAVVVRKDSKINSFAELKGRKVAMAVGSGQYSAFLAYARSIGLGEKDFSIVNAGDADAIAAMHQGSIDAVAYWEPVVSILEKQGIARRIFSFRGHVCNPGFWVASKAFAEQHPEVLGRFFGAVAECLDALTTNPQKMSVLVAKRMAAAGQRVTAAVFEQSIRNNVWNPTFTDGIRRDLIAEWNAQKAKGRVRGDAPDWDTVMTKRFIDEGVSWFEKVNGRAPKFSTPDPACK
ncbi:MAG: NrtA/SsuA/CpmA family ABC transporter substrate-binding protein [Rhodospirillaceae bacterium]|nr:NrtA/SsuA/CpmA family ABC transporter substrate-binding protein [Rhodospirillaceae bacterium]